MATYPLILTEKLDQSISGSFNERRLELAFGGGYRQTMADGINTDEGDWDLAWSSLTIDEARQLKAFFSARKGTERITWIPPLETQEQLFTCVDHGFALQNGSGILFTYKAKLRREFAP